MTLTIVALLSMPLSPLIRFRICGNTLVSCTILNALSTIGSLSKQCKCPQSLTTALCTIMLLMIRQVAKNVALVTAAFSMSAWALPNKCSATGSSGTLASGTGTSATDSEYKSMERSMTHQTTILTTVHLLLLL